MDIVLEILAIRKTHSVSGPVERTARRYRRGDVHNVLLPSQVGPVAIGCPFVYVHITGVPDVYTFEQVKQRITRPGLGTLDEFYRRRNFRIPFGQLPVAVRNELIANREINATWTQVKNFIRRKNVIVPNDPTQDDETGLITDLDLE